MSYRNHILCYCTWEDFTFELFKAVSDEKEWHDYPAQFRYIRIKTPDTLETIKSEQSQNCLILELSMSISDEKRWHDYPSQFGYTRIKTLDALEIIKSEQFQNWLISDESKHPIKRIRGEAKKNTGWKNAHSSNYKKLLMSTNLGEYALLK